LCSESRCEMVGARVHSEPVSVLIVRNFCVAVE
jgi:hypothetical protein